MSKALQRLRDALFETGMLQPVESSVRGGNLSVLCRQVEGQGDWIGLVRALLIGAAEDGYELHVGRRYKLKDVKTGELGFGLFLGLEAPKAKDLVEVVDKVCAVLKSAAPAALNVVPRNGRDAPPPPVATAPATPQAIQAQAPARVPQVRIIRSKTADGQGQEIMEMPLPHVYHELNVPKPGSSKGARFTGSGSGDKS